MFEFSIRDTSRIINGKSTIREHYNKLVETKEHQRQKTREESEQLKKRIRAIQLNLKISSQTQYQTQYDCGL